VGSAHTREGIIPSTLFRDVYNYVILE
jgi:hypothetical protein